MNSSRGGKISRQGGHLNETKNEERAVHWIKGLGALCKAPGTVTITWSPEHVTCPDCKERMSDDQEEERPP